MSQEKLAMMRTNHSNQEIDILIGNLFPTVEEPLSNALVALLHHDSSPTSSGHSQSSLSKGDDILEICKKKYFQALAQQYELKSSVGISPIKFLLKEELCKGMREAENQAMDIWSSFTHELSMDDDEWKRNKKRLHKFISDFQSQVQLKNSSNHTLYAERVRNTIWVEFKEIFEKRYQFLCSAQPESPKSAHGKISFQKFYDLEKLKRVVDCMASHVTKSCEQFTLKLNPLYDKGLDSDKIFMQLKEDVHNWGINLVEKNYKYMTTIQEYVNTSIILKFESQSKAEIREMLQEKPARDFNSTKERIRSVLKACMDPCIVKIDQIFNEFAIDNCQQFLEKYNQLLEQKMVELCAETIVKWRCTCTNVLKSHHDRMRGKIFIKSQSTPQFVLDIYAKHLEKAVELAKIEVEEIIFGTQDEELSSSIVVNNDELNGGAIGEASIMKTFSPKSRTATPQKTKASVSDGRRSKTGQHASPNTSIASGSICYNDGTNGDDGQSHKRRKS